MLGAALLIIAAVVSGLFIFSTKRAPTGANTSTATPAKSIAVLPFENLSEEKGNAYFADGIQDEILARLSKIADLKVISRTSTQKYKSAPDNLREIARQLGVSNILEGSVQKAADQVRVNVQLINALNDAHLWSDIYDRKLTDIFAVESDIASTIAATLQARLTGSEKTAIAKRPTANPEAYELYLKGRFFWNKRTGADLRTAISYFQQAIDKDRNYALAYVGVADCYLVLEEYAGAPARETYPKAKAFAERALQLDDLLAEAHTSLAFACRGLWQWDDAQRESKRAIELNPNYSTAHHWYSLYLVTVGRFDEALAESRRAQELDPLSLIINANVANFYLSKGDVDSAVEQSKKIIELDASNPLGHWCLGMADRKQQRYSDAIAELQKAVQLSGRASLFLGDLGCAYAISGNRAEALAVLKELEEKYAKHEAIGQYLAVVYSGLGDKDQAFAWLEKDFQARSGLLGYITLLTGFESLRSDPRYADLLHRMGLRQ